MKILVTVDMYSGRPNPSWEIPESELGRLIEMFQGNRVATQKMAEPMAGRLGYRGIQITPLSVDAPIGNTKIFDGVIDVSQGIGLVDENSVLEQYILSTAGNSLSEEERTYLQQEVRKNFDGGALADLKDVQVLAVPPYNPGKWNNDPTIKRMNNCYNYANDKITNTFAQPGLGSGAQGPYPPTCPGTGAAAQRDGQIPVPNPDITPAEGQIVALVVAPGPSFFDYHWYRKDINNMWSHKPGQTPATNVDQSGRSISDPRTCNRGPYSLFCGFYNSIPARTRIR